LCALVALAAAATGPVESAQAASRAPGPGGGSPRAVAAARAPGQCAGGHRRPGARNLLLVELTTLCMIDAIRAGDHLHVLRPNRDLAGVASGQVGAMLRLDYFADVRPTGQTPLALVDSTPYPASASSVAVGENLAWGLGDGATPLQVVAALMASPPHREVILDPSYRDVGIAVAPRVPRVVARHRHGATYAIEFGVRLAAGTPDG
jgi:uncharacterized protein YkwD